MRTAVIGAGLAGLAAARDLAAAGHVPVVFEKSRGIGGRIATRRTEGASFDHGAPLLHGVPAEIRAAAGASAACWRDGVVGVPRNSALPRALAEGLDVRGRTAISGLRRTAAGWELRSDAGAAIGADRVLVALPHPQALALVGGWAARFPGIAAVDMAPGWTLMAEFAAPVDAPDWATLAPPLGLAIRSGAKPGRSGPDGWVVHADPEFSAAHLEADTGTMARQLVEAFRAVSVAPPPIMATAHRWRYARTTRALGRACLWDAEMGLGLAGDWCLGADAGDAIASGKAAAAALLATS